MIRTKTIGHGHIDPLLINQSNHGLKAGQFVYLNSHGEFKPAVSKSFIESQVEGIIWSVPNTDSFFIFSAPGLFKYRFPFTKEWFNVDEHNNVLENSPNEVYLPGEFGEELYLSETNPGYMQKNKPNTFPVLLGYKTHFGMSYRPQFVDNTTVGYSSDISGNCLYSLYNICYFREHAENNSNIIPAPNTWELIGQTLAEMREIVPPQLANVPLTGIVNVVDLENYSIIECVDNELRCINTSDTLSEIPNISGSFANIRTFHDYLYVSDYDMTHRTFIKPIYINEPIENIFSCSSNDEVTFLCPISGQDCEICCLDVSGGNVCDYADTDISTDCDDCIEYAFGIGTEITPSFGNSWSFAITTESKNESCVFFKIDPETGNHIWPDIGNNIQNYNNDIIKIGPAYFELIESSNTCCTSDDSTSCPGVTLSLLQNYNQWSTCSFRKITVSGVANGMMGPCDSESTWNVVIPYFCGNDVKYITTTFNAQLPGKII